jgi:hypothetical protein
MKIKNEEGEEIEVFTPEELKAKEEELTSKHTAEAEKLKADLATATVELGKLKESDKNFGELRTAKEKLEKDLTEKETAHKAEIESIKNAGAVAQVEGLIKAIVGTDAEMRKKMEYHMTKTLAGMPVTSKEEMEEKVKSAYRLSADVPDVDKINGIISSAGAGGGEGSGNLQVSPELKQLGRNFGLSDADWENAHKSGII